MLITSIFKNLFDSSSYYKIVYPNLTDRYFMNDEEKTIFTKIKDFSIKYDKQPTFSDVKLLLDTDNKISEKDLESCYQYLTKVQSSSENLDEEALIDKTEDFCQQKSLELAILDSVEVLEKDPKSRGIIKDKIEDALSVCFNIQLGHDFFKDAPKRFKSYSEVEDKISLHVEALNFAFGGGLCKKALYIGVAPPNKGKSLIGCHMTSSLLKSGHNVIYISAEMSEERIAQRIDANVLDIPIGELGNFDKKTYINKVKSLYDQTKGKLIIKEYPTGGASMNHVKAFLNELKLKKKFKPDVIVFDYLNIFASSRLPASAAMNSYQYIKAIGEEMRALCVQHDVVGITFSQINRGGAAKNGTGMDMQDVSDCIYVEEKVKLLTGEEIKIKNTKIGDKIITNDGFKTVMMVHHTKIKKCYKITLKSGKSIIVSGEHKFPTNDGRKCINDGLSIGDMLNSK